jgi:hypothetical protein
MSLSIDQAFVSQFEYEVKDAYQRMASKLRGTIRTTNGVRGATARFQKIGAGVAAPKSRHGLVPVMNLGHSFVDATLVDRYAGEWVDKLDELKINHDERGAITRAEAAALGRATDQDIIDQLDTATTFTTTITKTTQASIRNSVLAATQAMNERDVPDDNARFAVISPSMWAAFMTIDQFSNSQYVGPDLPYMNASTSLKSWLGFHWQQHTGLTKTGNNRAGYFYHSTALGHAIGADVTTDITWHGDRASNFIAAMMSMGAALIDTIGVQQLIVDETAALPTT